MPIRRTSKQLAQRLVSTTSAAVLYTAPLFTTRVLLRNVFICNTTAAAKTFSIYINQNGTATGDQFALYKSVPLAANETQRLILGSELEDGVVLSGASASVLVSASAGSAVTFTLYGIEVEET